MRVPTELWIAAFYICYAIKHSSPQNMLRVLTTGNWCGLFMNWHLWTDTSSEANPGLGSEEQMKTLFTSPKFWWCFPLGEISTFRKWSVLGNRAFTTVFLWHTGDGRICLTLKAGWWLSALTPLKPSHQICANAQPRKGMRLAIWFSPSDSLCPMLGCLQCKSCGVLWLWLHTAPSETQCLTGPLMRSCIVIIVGVALLPMCHLCASLNYQCCDWKNDKNSNHAPASLIAHPNWGPSALWEHMSPSPKWQPYSHACTQTPLLYLSVTSYLSL